MKPQYVPALALGVLALFANGCAHHSARPTTSTNPATSGKLTEVIELPRQSLTFQPTRDDITVGCVIFALNIADPSRALDLEALRVNGIKLKAPRLYLLQVGENRFELPALKIEFSRQALGGPLYLSLKAWFNELNNQQDSPYYENVPDRYALLSYCTQEDQDASKVNVRLGANRVATLAEFKTNLARPFVIRLNQSPLPADGGRYPMLDPMPPHNPLSEAELKAVEQTVRERGEQFVRAISMSDANHAIVTVGDGTFFRGARQYQVRRNGSAWRIDSVKPIQESGW
jgi:hypothetical protein